jgi:hypothetical protein
MEHFHFQRPCSNLLACSKDNGLICRAFRKLSPYFCALERCCDQNNSQVKMIVLQIVQIRLDVKYIILLLE